MKRRGFVFWLVLFVAGSVIWLQPMPWADVMGRLIVFTAVFVGVTAPRWRTEARFRTPRVVVAIQFVNLLPMFVLGSSPSLASRSSLLTVIYLVVAVAVVAINSYFGLSRRGDSAA